MIAWLLQTGGNQLAGLASFCLDLKAYDAQIERAP